jgi:hypothetical protein
VNKPSLIAQPQDVNTDWLTQVLRYNGYEASVNSFSVEQIGTGQMARCFRYSLNVKGDENAPRSLIGKFNSTDPGTLQVAIDYGNYASEVGFYQHLAPRLPVSTARCFFAEIDREKRNFTLMLQDMSPAKQGDQMAGCSLAVAKQAVDEMAAMHTATWNDESLRDHTWLHSLSDLQEGFFKEQQEFTPEFIKRLGDRLEPRVLELVHRMAEGCDNLVSCLKGQPQTLMHWDYRADNLLIDEEQQSPSITAVDWQTVMIGAPLQDVAYFIGASLKTDLRREHEMALLESYYDNLVERCVSDFSWEECLLGYQLGSFSGLTMAVRAAELVVETTRGNEMFATMARRHGNQILDLDADRLLG